MTGDRNASRITQVIAVPAVGAGYYEDLAALRMQPVPLQQRFTAPAVTPGFQAVREVAEAVSVGLVLDDGRVAWGDCVGTSGDSELPILEGDPSGGPPLFRAPEGLATIERVVAPWLEGRPIAGFRELAAEVGDQIETVEVTRPVPQSRRVPGEGLPRRALLTAPARLLQAAREEEGVPTERVSVERPLHPAIRYGVSQALLQAVAMVRGVPMAEVIATEWALPVPHEPVPIHVRFSSHNHDDADRMIVHRVASLCHDQEGNAAYLGPQEEGGGQSGTAGLTRLVRWLRERIPYLGGEDYRPTIYLDLHGALGRMYDNQMGRILGQLYAWELAARPFVLNVEDPLILSSREAQIEAMGTLRQYVRLRKMSAQLVAKAGITSLDDASVFVAARAADMLHIRVPDLGSIDQAVEAVLACRAGGVGALLGGSHAETDLSARVAVHVALATRPDLLMARPGAGVDAAVSLVHNEMARTLAYLERRKS
jgi:methylaspartate ammonia-lyase